MRYVDIIALPEVRDGSHWIRPFGSAVLWRVADGRVFSVLTEREIEEPEADASSLGATPWVLVPARPRPEQDGWEAPPFDGVSHYRLRSGYLCGDPDPLDARHLISVTLDEIRPFACHLCWQMKLDSVMQGLRP
jgi:hypothetical protein